MTAFSNCRRVRGMLWVRKYVNVSTATKLRRPSHELASLHFMMAVYTTYGNSFLSKSSGLVWYVVVLSVFHYWLLPLVSLEAYLIKRTGFFFQQICQFQNLLRKPTNTQQCATRWPSPRIKGGRFGSILVISARKSYEARREKRMNERVC